MKTDEDYSTEIPCFKCLFWNKERKHLHCNHNECQELTEWLVRQAEKISRLKKAVEELKALEKVSIGVGS